jgi:RNA polymerase sigma-70 factor, ECF subfamily
MDDDSARWVAALAPGTPGRDAAVARLHDLLLRVARHELRRRHQRWGIEGPELEDLAHQAAADALLALLGKLGQFRGESRFTTWAYRFAVVEVSTKLGRHFWRSAPAACAEEDWDLLPDRFGLSPQTRAEWHELVGALRRAVEEDLTPHQRRIFGAIVLRGIPLDALVVELGSNRNAIYKAMFDARRKLRDVLAANGYVDLDVVNVV